jgi:hypothetical protein
VRRVQALNDPVLEPLAPVRARSAKLQAGMLFGLHMSVPAFFLRLDIVLLSHWTLPTLLTSFLATCSPIPDILLS